MQNSDFPIQRINYASTILNNYSFKNYNDNTDLLIHIRSGDIFRFKTAHKKYGQPPLAFYILCINHKKPKSITLVFEDYSNPVIRLLISYINSINCKLKLNNINNLKKDVSSILNAKTVVLGNGTFVPEFFLVQNRSILFMVLN